MLNENGEIAGKASRAPCLIAVILFFMFWPFFNTHAAEIKFIKTEKGYTFQARIFIKSPPECVIKIIYDFNHLKSFVKRAQSVELVSKPDQPQEVQYTVKRFFWEMKETYRRTLDNKEQKISFEMIQYKPKGVFLPKQLASSGYYLALPAENGCWLEYYEDCGLTEGKFRSIYFREAEKEGKRYLNDVKEYVEKICTLPCLP